MQTDVSPLRLSISSGSITHETAQDDLAAVRSAGFTHLHFSHLWRSSDWLSAEQIALWRRHLDTHGVEVLDVHGWHLNGANLWEEDADGRAHAVAANRERLRLTHELGGDGMVYHVPTGRELTDANFAYLIEGLERLEEFARERHIVIALENHYVAETDKRALSVCFERFDPEYVGFTFDVGHALISGNSDWLLDNCMNRLHVLHLNDNDGEKDLHWLPYQGVADWSRVVRGIAASSYNKPLQLEVKWHEDRYATFPELLQAAHESALRLHHEIETARAELGRPGDQ